MFLAALAIALTGLIAVSPAPAQAAVIGDNYPAYLANAKQDALVDPWRFYNRECTSFVAWRLNNTNGVKFTNQYLGADLWWGNANTWGTSARAKGVLVDKTPAVGSVAWSTAGKYGHVAWVAEVLGDGKIVVEEYNWGVSSSGEKGRYRVRTALASSFTGFIHIKDLKSWPPSDGAFINVQETGEVYRIAGGAPLYVSDWAVFGGPQHTQSVTKAKFDTLPKVPKNGTFIRGQITGGVYTIAHGAPIHVATWAGIGGEKPTIGVDDAAINNAGQSGVWRFLKAVPTSGFIRGASSYRIYHVVNGRPYYVSSWAPFGGEKPVVSVDDASIDSCNHLNCDPWGAFDGVSGGKGIFSVAGWAQDPNSVNPLKIHVYADGVMVGETRTDRARTDIEAKYHRGLNYGYKASFAAKPGNHEVCAYVINAGMGKNNTHLGCKTVTVSPLSTFMAQPTPKIAGVSRIDEILTATVGSWKPAASVTLQWHANGAAIPGATGAQLKISSAMAGKKITVAATATLSGYTAATRTSTPTAAVAPLIAYSVAPTPTVSGTNRVGSTLTGTAGVWKPGATTRTVAWLRDGKPIVGATSATYMLVAADMGKKITFAVTSATRGYVTTTRTSAPTAPVSGLGFTTAPVPTITGKVVIGRTITATAAAWAPGPLALSYQWLRDGAVIPGANKAAYVVVAKDVATSLSVVVTGTKSGYTPLAKSSAATAKVSPLAFEVSPDPVVSGISRVGQTLTGELPGWKPAPITVKYQWTRGGVPIPNATAKTYKLAPQDAGQVIAVVTTSEKPGFTSITKTSAGTAKVALLTLTATPIPGISGAAKVDQTVAVKTAAWTPSPVTLSYQWNRNGNPISGANKNTYSIVAADKGASVTVTVTGSRAGYASVTKTSAAIKPQ